MHAPLKHTVGFSFRRLLRSPLILVLLGLAQVGYAQPGQRGGTRTAPGALADGQVFNIIEWDGAVLPPVYERSDQQPLSLDDVRKLSDSGFDNQAVIKIIEERRCACDASVDALVALKEAGVADEVIQAVSLHALAPNRSLFLTLSLDFEGIGGAPDVSAKARRGYLYLIIPDGDRERIFIGNLQSILAGQWQADAVVDQTDLLLPKKVRRVAFASRVPLKTAGPKKAMVFTSTKPDIYTSADIPQADRAGLQEYLFEYPASSPLQACSLQALYRQDTLLADRWHLVRTNFQCEWD
jgi:hypothetical protein